jgi:HSF-type DNA-binding
MPYSHHSQQQEPEIRGAKFPEKLYDFLELATSNEKLAAIVSWLPDGHSFNVHDHVSFTEFILPKYFGGMNHYRSFRRQLNHYGIHKRIERSQIVTASPSSAENHHHHHHTAGSLRNVAGKILLNQRGGRRCPAALCSDYHCVRFFVSLLPQLDASCPVASCPS